MTVRFHLFPFRTQKLSSLVPKIVRWKRRVKIGSRRLEQKRFRRDSEAFFFCRKALGDAAGPVFRPVLPPVQDAHIDAAPPQTGVNWLTAIGLALSGMTGRKTKPLRSCSEGALLFDRESFVKSFSLGLYGDAGIKKYQSFGGVISPPLSP